MSDKLTNLDHLRAASKRSQELSAQVASAAAAAIEELASQAVTREEMNAAIDAAIRSAVLNSWEGSY